MRIGEVAREAGVSVRSLRYYEEQGLLTSTRTPAGQREYDAEAVDRVRLIQQLYSAGLGSRAVLQLMPCVYTGFATPDMVHRLIDERTRIDEQIDELRSARERLDDVIRAARGSAAPADDSLTLSDHRATVPV